MLTNRPVRGANILTICEFPQSERELFFLHPQASYPLTYEQLNEAIEQRTDSTVVLWDGKISAFANFYLCEPGEKCGIGNVIVAPQARGNGVGRYLLETMIQLAFHKHDVREVEIACFNQNAAGLLLYSKLGFQPYAIEEWRDRQHSRVALVRMRIPRSV